MNESHIIKTLNMSEGEAITLEKAADRMEFEALPLVMERWCVNCHCNGDTTYTSCGTNN